MGASATQKQKEQGAQQRATQDRAQQLQLMADAMKPTPLQTEVENSRLADVKYFNNPVPDYTTAPAGMIDSTAFQRGALQKLQERTATGGSQMGAYGQDANLLTLNRERNNTAIAEQGAGQYASNLASRRAEAFGGAEGLMSLNLQRSLGLTGMANNNANASQQAYMNFKPAPSLWANLLMAGVQGATGIASAYAGRPPGAQKSRRDKDNR
ncbi:MAG: hypothetical protein ACR2LC_14885 [Pyrinomonadaceae bacterium]